MDINQTETAVEAEAEPAIDMEATVATVTEEKPVTADDIKKGYYPMAQLADAQIAIEKATTIAAALGLETVFNFETDKPFPEGYGIALGPISKRINNVNVTLGVHVSAIPDLATVQAHENGLQFITDAVVGNMVAKLQNAVRPRGESGETAASIPFSVEDFITSNRAEGVLLAFRTFAKAYVKVLKGKGLTFITESILRQTLQSAAFSKQQFPSIPQDKWTQIIDSMIARAEHAGIAVGMLADWRVSRDSAELKDVNVDLADLDFDDDGEIAAVEAVAPEVATQ